MARVWAARGEILQRGFDLPSSAPPVNRTRNLLIRSRSQRPWSRARSWLTNWHRPF